MINVPKEGDVWSECGATEWGWVRAEEKIRMKGPKMEC